MPGKSPPKFLSLQIFYGGRKACPVLTCPVRGKHDLVFVRWNGSGTQAASLRKSQADNVELGLVNIEEVNVDRSTLRIFTDFQEADDEDRAHRRNASPAERLLALELMRQSAYGYSDPDTPRLQRVLEIVRGE